MLQYESWSQAKRDLFDAEVWGTMPVEAPDQYRTYLVCEIEGLSRDEASRMLGIPPAHVRVYHCRARARVKKICPWLIP